MELTFLGGASEVGASCTLLQVAGRTLLVDGGMRPAAREGQSRLPDLSLLNKQPPEALIITHAHIDHTGALPLIASLLPHIPIYATESTRVLTEVLLRDSVRIMEQEHLRPDGETPLYNAEQVDAFLGRIQVMGFRQPFAPLADSPGITVQFIPAGHILGAAMLFFETPEGTLFHTGDISLTDQRTIKGLDINALPKADVMITEGTYGNRSHSSRKEEEQKLAATVQAVLARGGRILCPAFAVGRAQEIILILKAYRASGKISPVPIYLDGMVRSVCDVYQQQSHDLQPTLQRHLINGRRPLFADPQLHVFSVRSFERRDLVQHTKPKMVISSSGMLSGGASPLYALDIAAREQDCLLFTGYQDEESPGYALLNAKQGDRIRIGEEFVTLNCQVARYNLSGHADANQIQAVVSKVQPARLILVHGDSEALKALSQRFKHLSVAIPHVGTTLSITPTAKVLASSATSQRAIYADALSPGTTPLLAGSDPGQDMSSPTLQALWEKAHTHGPLRPWTSVELGQHYYGPDYRPALRPLIEQVLRDATTHFKLGRLGAQTTYQPRASEAIQRLTPLVDLVPGEVVLVQGQNSSPQIALVLSAPQDGTLSLVADQWKQAQRPLNVIQLLPGVSRPEWLILAPGEIKQQLQAWRKQLDNCWIDLFTLWERAQGQPFTYAQLCTQVADEDERLAWGLELLAHGRELFNREGESWLPLEREQVAKNPGFSQHLALIRAGEGAAVMVNDQPASLTGKSSWRLFEIQWQAGPTAGQHHKVRSANIRFK
ncbi:MBL fold metallo-hydrolase [Ktedonobacter robiniae]|uniref:MBL fold metallo-hydrolase n=1 Tax=Ktedonobacter robiniae TaxID=2778365 RepID=A0ABQ3UW77_9CHLR|nr:MBL fold metallo-hydrolase [Ktedonobacter robiniae]GHO57096.1 hypothetical protein KSB_55710 [Ktedonobacter robiniae]